LASGKLENKTDFYAVFKLMDTPKNYEFKAFEILKPEFTVVNEDFIISK